MKWFEYPLPVFIFFAMLYLFPVMGCNSEGAQSDGKILRDGAGGDFRTSNDLGGSAKEKGASSHNLNKLFFLHHSTGDGLVVGGDMRGAIASYNSSHGTKFEFWDHGYNEDGLRDASGNSTGTNYAIPDDNTDPEGLNNIWTSAETPCVDARGKILNQQQVIAFKSCFTAPAISSDTALDENKAWYLKMRSSFDTRTDKLFVVVTTPPLHRLATNDTEAQYARAIASWLCSAAYLSGHPNIACFNLFDKLARADDGSASANRLRAEYEGDPQKDDSHPNDLANTTIGPQLAQFLIDTALAY